jgi:tubulin monoglycylase TTLL3/8
MVKSYQSTFIWTVRSANVDHSYLSRDQLFNHFNKNGAFTTKIGLCTNLRNLQWYSPYSCDEFFPRCYKLSQEDDKQAFIDDYRLTCCISMLKYSLQKYRGEPDYELDIHITSDKELDLIKAQVQLTEQLVGEDDRDSQCKSSLSIQEGQINAKLTTKEATVAVTPSILEPLRSSTSEPQKSITQNQNRNRNLFKKAKLTIVPIEAIEFAIEHLEKYIEFKLNEDLDKQENNSELISDDKWSQFNEWFYAVCHDKIQIEFIDRYIDKIILTLERVNSLWPQYNMDGTNSIWIVKPGAKSRGRGIIVFNKLENILELTGSSLQREGKYVVQKYIERPLLIHKTKFDIRQWFLITDFNPLTIYTYKDCYLRFCTENFSLDDCKESIHLCNYSIQKNYKHSSDRNEELPIENMWTNEEFIQKYLTRIGKADAWNDIIFPGMKNAILCAMQSTQDIIENRKNSFELYGADFMITDDLKPWLIEINCSPTMARSTEITALLCDNVLDDICKGTLVYTLKLFLPTLNIHTLVF